MNEPLYWGYFVSRLPEGAVLEIVRRGYDGAQIPGPWIEALDKTGVWRPRPEILGGFQDPGWYVPVTREEAEQAAASLGLTLPVEQPA